jgi:hypothetical protein
VDAFRSVNRPSDVSIRIFHSFCVCQFAERCLRCLPQDEDTGGFFVATLRKRSDSAAPPDVEPEVLVEVDGGQSEAHAGGVPSEAAETQAEASRLKKDFVSWDSASFERVICPPRFRLVAALTYHFR